MSNTKIRFIAIGCLLVGVMGGVAGAQALQALQRRVLYSALFSVRAGETASLYVTLEGRTRGGPARVLLQFLNEKGDVVAHDEAVLEAGQSATLHSRYDGLLRARAAVVETALTLAARPVLGGVEVIDTIGIVRPIPPTIPIFDPNQIPGGRN